MSQSKLPAYVLNDLIKFIHETYRDGLPHSLLIAQAFLLEFKEYGKKYDLSIINDAVEEIIENNRD
jgi:hypothetical protein